MELAPRRWGWRSLVGAWGAYWAGLAAVTLGPFARYVWDLSRVPGNHGNVSLSVGDGGLHLTALMDGVTAWNGSVGLGAFALWVAGPPLALWVLWLLLRPSPNAGDALREVRPAGALRDGASPAWAVRDPSDANRSPVERGDSRR